MKALLARLGNPLEWSTVDKSLLVIVPCWFTAAIIYVELGAWRVEMAAELPNYADWLADAFIRNEIVLMTVWALLIAWGIAIRRRSPRNRVYLWTMVTVFAASLITRAYFAGPFISPLWALMAGGGIVGLLLFAPRVVAYWLFLCLAGFFGVALATWKGWLPYASLLEALPDDYAGNPRGVLWIFVMTSNSLLFVAMAFLIFVYTVNRWRQREAELVVAHAALAQSQQRLGRATNLIRRYVATQVADRVLAGDEPPIGSHERRTLTIFYSDIKGFTEASDQIDPEELSRVLNEYLSEMTTIAMAHGGTIDKFVGDAIMIFFGAPTAMDEKTQALNAVRMAIAMGTRMEYLRNKWYDEGMQFPFEKRVGINTGLASVGNFGSQERLDYTVIGQQVNLAAKLESTCEPGRILISDATWALVKDEIPCVPKGVLAASGLERPIGTYEVAT